MEREMLNDSTSHRTVNVRIWGQRVPAYAETVERTDGTTVRIVRVYDDVAGGYTMCHDLTEAQEKFVIGRTLDR